MTDNENQLFENLAIEHMDSLYSKAIRMAGSAESAEILVQQTYAAAFNAFEQFDKDSDFCQWLQEILILISRKQPARQKFASYDSKHAPCAP